MNIKIFHNVEILIMEEKTGWGKKHVKQSHLELCRLEVSNTTVRKHLLSNILL